ncbi:C6 transcription factor [Akanthomyces lecanii RCEF 1005]|uniref:C6 transcription factor n=1 Tax=Akanthomyces lecanii RCEF 1005 TaxID=1081108 RepID=A0A162JK09_CORDF|nr:C6 transcription factor [Akanthomyces lecanii RCEF 1005]
MTQMMSVSLGRLTVGKALDGLDVEETEPSMAIRPASLPNDRFHGPFGVLHMQTRQSSETSSSLPDRGHEYHAEAGNMASQSNCAPTSRPSAQSAAERTPTLLQYFKSHVISFSHATRRETTICPWQNIHAPAAEATYEELRLRSVPAPTDLSLLNSLLASSCFHLASRDTASGAKWAELGEQYKQEARQHLDIAIQEEILSLTQTNYEELLMALLSMTMLEAYTVCQLRTLHHVYTYLRIMTESTCGCILRNICPARPGSRMSLVTEESRHKLRSFRVADQSTESDLRMSIQKIAPAAYEDVHLEVMGDWTKSLFPELYGLPESLLGLLSQTIRLANEQELLHRDANVDVSMITNLCRRTKALEQNILSWKLPYGQIIPRLATTFHQAVILFYYRRVQNINGLMLQDGVQKVLANLSATDEPHEAAPLLWPAFLAACEAIEPFLREGLEDWLVRMGERTCIPAFGAVAEMARQVWALREEKRDYTLSWFDVTNLGRCPIVAL